jgi:hypothetical protein
MTTRASTIQIPRSVFRDLAEGRGILGSAAILSDPHVRQYFVKTLRHYMFHTDLKALGMEPEQFASLFGATVGEHMLGMKNDPPADDSPQVLRSLSIARLTVAHATRVLRSDELLRKAFHGVSDIEQAIGRVVPPGRIPTLASLIAYAEEIDISRRIPDENSIMVVHGRLYPFQETGTEGVIWSVDDDLALSYDALRPLEAGDHLQIFGSDGSILWSGPIDNALTYQGWDDPVERQWEFEASMARGFSSTSNSERWDRMFYRRRCARLVKSQSVTSAALTVPRGREIG